MYIAPGPGQTTPWGQIFLLSVLFSQYSPLLQVSPYLVTLEQFSPFKCIGDPI